MRVCVCVCISSDSSLFIPFLWLLRDISSLAARNWWHTCRHSIKMSISSSVLIQYRVVKSWVCVCAGTMHLWMVFFQKRKSTLPYVIYHICVFEPHKSVQRFWHLQDSCWYFSILTQFCYLCLFFIFAMF